MKFLAITNRRHLDLEANHGAHALSLAEKALEEGETITRVILSSRRGIDPNPVMPADHARNVALGGRCTCGSAGPDEFGNFDQLEDPDCPRHGPAVPSSEKQPSS